MCRRCQTALFERDGRDGRHADDPADETSHVHHPMVNMLSHRCADAVPSGTGKPGENPKHTSHYTAEVQKQTSPNHAPNLWTSGAVRPTAQSVGYACACVGCRAVRGLSSVVARSRARCVHAAWLLCECVSSQVTVCVPKLNEKYYMIELIHVLCECVRPV